MRVNKKTLLFCLLLAAIACATNSQTKNKLDITSYEVPEGWKSEKKSDSVIFSTEDQKKSFAIITLYQSESAGDDLRKEFESSWRKYVNEKYQTKEVPKPNQEKSVHGWDQMTGGAIVKTEKGDSMALLLVFSREGKKVPLLFVTNERDYFKVLDVFIFHMRFNDAPLPNQDDPPPQKPGGL